MRRADQFTASCSTYHFSGWPWFIASIRIVFKNAIQMLETNAEAKLEEFVPLDRKTLSPVVAKYTRIGPFAIPKRTEAYE